MLLASCAPSSFPWRHSVHLSNRFGVPSIEPPKPRKGNRVLLTIDLSAPVLAEALADEQVSAILAYHPAIFRGTKRFSLADHTQRTVLECAAAGIGIYSPHTALDACEGGINDWLARGCGAGTVAPITPADNPPEGKCL